MWISHYEGMDPTQQERMNKIMGTQTVAPAPSQPAQEAPIIPDTPSSTVMASGSMAAKKSSSMPVIVIAAAIFFIIYAVFWAYIFKLIKF